MIPLSHGLILGSSVFAIGLFGVLTRSNLLMILMSLELMLSGVILNFVFVSYRLGLWEGQMVSLFLMVIAASEVTIGLALCIAVYRRKATLDVSVWNNLKEGS